MQLDIALLVWVRSSPDTDTGRNLGKWQHELTGCAGRQLDHQEVDLLGDELP